MMEGPASASRDAMPTLLYIAVHVPPFASSASLRARGFCRYLPGNGWGVVVVTPADILDGVRDFDLLDGWPAGVTVEPFRAGGIARSLARRAARGGEIFDAAALEGAPAAMRRFLRRANALLVPDVLVAMHRPFVRSAVRAGRKFGVRAVVATSPPESSLLIGAEAARRLGVPFFADLRDAWTLGPYAATGKSRGRRDREARQERTVLGRAARVFCVSETMRARYAEAYPEWGERFVVLENGYDEADFAETPPLRDGSWNLLHAGSLKSRERLAAALRVADAFASGGVEEGAVLEFAGDAPPELRARVSLPDAAGKIRLLGARPHREAVARLRGAGALLLLADRGPEIVTGKLAEYLRAGRPILALAPGEGEAARKLAAHPHAEVVPLERLDVLPGRLAAFVARCRSRGDVGTPAPRAATRESVARELARHLDAAAGPARGGAPAEARAAAPVRGGAPAEARAAGPVRGGAPDRARARAGFVVITRDRPAELRRALDSLRTQVGPAREVLVVDNGSRDPAAVAAACAGVARVLRLDRNLGVAEARNRGARASTADLFVFLDDDASFRSPLAARRIEEEFAARPDVAVLAFRIVREGGRVVRREFPSRRFWRADWPHEAPYFCGGGSAVRRGDFESLGGFDEAFFYALEELDFSLRAAAAGRTIRYVPTVEVLHEPSERGRDTGGWIYHQLRSRWILARKDLPLWPAASHLAVWNAYLFVRGARDGSLAAVWRGMRDGIRGARAARRDPVSAEVVVRLARLGGRTFY